MKKLFNKLILGLLALSLLAGCKKTPPTTSDIDDSSLTTDVTSEDSSENSEEGGGIVGDPIAPGEVPEKIRFYVATPDEAHLYQLWVWDDSGKEGEAVDWDSVEGDWAIKEFLSSYFESINGVNIILRSKNSWAWQTTDTTIKYCDFGQVDGVMSVYCIVGEGDNIELYHQAEDALGDNIITAAFTDFTHIKVVADAVPITFDLYVNGELEKAYEGVSATQVLTLEEMALLFNAYEVRAKFPSKPTKERARKVNPSALYDHSHFLNTYVYNGDDLGVTYTPSKSTFKLWAPTASSVSLLLFRSGTPSSVVSNILLDTPKAVIPMTYFGQGVYTCVVEEDLHNTYYMYRVTNSLGTNDVCDPYAKAVGINGVRSLVLDFSQTDPLGFRNLEFPVLESPTDLIVYEMHIQDLTHDETWTGPEEKRGKYLGVIEEGTTYTEGSVTVRTGFDHIKELGVNAVQIMPFYDQANYEEAKDGVPVSYNWGYNPLNFNALEGAYSSDPRHGEVRVGEFKQLVQKFAENDIRIIMDVVYNHVSSYSSSSFQKVVPNYYFRYNEDGTLNNDSGVGNVFASERAMARNFIVNSVKHWASEYQIKGFRFDLMQLIHTDTLRAVEVALKEIDPSIVIWGEPWSAGGYWGDMVYSQYLGDTSIAQFNDQGRNGLKGENDIKQNKHWGWISKGPADNQEDASFINRTKGLMAGMIGQYYDKYEYRTNPKKNVQYVGCHDNYTIHDQFLANFGYNKDMALRTSVVATSILMTSQGIPFFQGGDEIGRTKPFNPETKIAREFMETHTYEWHVGEDGKYYSGNSYNIGYDTNSYKWDDKVSNIEIFNRYKEIIALRLSKKGFRMNTANEIKSKMGFFDQPLSYSTIAAWNTYHCQGSEIGAIYYFHIGRLAENDTTKETIAFTDGSFIVLYDSKNELTRQTFNGSNIAIERLRSVIIERIG